MYGFLGPYINCCGAGRAAALVPRLASGVQAVLQLLEFRIFHHARRRTRGPGPAGDGGAAGPPGSRGAKTRRPPAGSRAAKKTTGPLFENPKPPFSPQHRTRTDAITAVIGLLRRFAANSALKFVSDIYIFTKECIHLHYATFSKIPILTNIRAGPDGPGSLGSRGADFARGRGARGAGRRPPGTLPTLVRRGARCAGSRRARDHCS